MFDTIAKAQIAPITQAKQVNEGTDIGCRESISFDSQLEASDNQRTLNGPMCLTATGRLVLPFGLEAVSLVVMYPVHFYSSRGTSGQKRVR